MPLRKIGPIVVGELPSEASLDSEVTSAIAAHSALADPHSQYLTQTRGDARYRQSSVALSDGDIPATIARDSEVTSAIAAHTSASDPHTQYFNQTRGDARYNLKISNFFQASNMIGIGTASPLETLTVASNISNLLLIGSTAGGGNTPSLDFITNPSTPISWRTAKIHAYDQPGVAYGGGLIFSTNPGNTSTATERMRITSSGNVGIGQASPTQPLHMGSGAYVSTGGAWTNASDRRLKNTIEPITDYGLDEVLKLNPVRFFYNLEPNQLVLGFIAQEVREIIPEIVSGTEGDLEAGETLGISYGGFVPVLLNAIKDLNTELQTLRDRVEALEKN
jgi:hypothetical protein